MKFSSKSSTDTKRWLFLSKRLGGMQRSRTGAHQVAFPAALPFTLFFTNHNRKKLDLQKKSLTEVKKYRAPVIFGQLIQMQFPYTKIFVFIFE